MFQHFAEIMEPVLENEPGTVEVKVRAGMSRDHVVDSIMRTVEHLNS